jgi:hypothetical protein
VFHLKVCSISRDSKYLVTYFYYDDKVEYERQVLSTQTFASIAKLTGLSGYHEDFHDCHWTPNGKYIISGMKDKIQVFSTSTWLCTSEITTFDYV